MVLRTGIQAPEQRLQAREHGARHPSVRALHAPEPQLQEYLQDPERHLQDVKQEPDRHLQEGVQEHEPEPSSTPELGYEGLQVPVPRVMHHVSTKAV